jgi:hypothetical protein
MYGNLIGFLNSIDENIYEIIEDGIILCTKMYCNKEISARKNGKDNTGIKIQSRSIYIF